MTTRERILKEREQPEPFDNDPREAKVETPFGDVVVASFPVCHYSYKQY